MCSYHAWRWDGEGELAHVPQAQDTELERLKKNPKSKCNSFPIKEKNGLLWVWPSDESGKECRGVEIVETRGHTATLLDGMKLYHLFVVSFSGKVKQSPPS